MPPNADISKLTSSISRKEFFTGHNAWRIPDTRYLPNQYHGNATRREPPSQKPLALNRNRRNNSIQNPNFGWGNGPLRKVESVSRHRPEEPPKQRHANLPTPTTSKSDLSNPSRETPSQPTVPPRNINPFSPSAPLVLYTSASPPNAVGRYSRAFSSNPSNPPDPSPHLRIRKHITRKFATSSSPTSPAPISLDQYHHVADTYIDNLVAQLEELQEEREDVDCEYSAGVLTLTFPPSGTYVLNKQPPNKQIWLSSPVSGPKRYDYVFQQTSSLPLETSDEAGGGDSAVREGVGSDTDAEGEWVYLRDGSTLSGLLKGELGVHLDLKAKAD